jgi:flagellar hook-length control protein FliK
MERLVDGKQRGHRALPANRAEDSDAKDDAKWTHSVGHVSAPRNPRTARRSASEAIA